MNDSSGRPAPAVVVRHPKKANHHRCKANSDETHPDDSPDTEMAFWLKANDPLLNRVDCGRSYNYPSQVHVPKGKDRVFRHDSQNMPQPLYFLLEDSESRIHAGYDNHCRQANLPAPGDEIVGGTGTVFPDDSLYKLQVG